MADRVILLSGGRIEQNGTPADLYESPANTFVARFIGTPPMNLLRLEATARPARSSPARRAAGGAADLRRRHARRAPRARRSRARRGVRGDGRRRRIPRAPIRCSHAASATQPLTARVAGRAGLHARRRRAARRGRAGAQHFFDGATAMRREVEWNHQPATMRRLGPGVDNAGQEEEISMKYVTHVRAGRGARAAALSSAGRCAGAGRDFVLLPGCGRRSDHQDHRRLRRGFRKGKSGHQGQADLFGQLSGFDHQGAHRGQEQRRADDVGACCRPTCTR